MKPLFFFFVSLWVYPLLHWQAPHYTEAATLSPSSVSAVPPTCGSSGPVLLALIPPQKIIRLQPFNVTLAWTRYVGGCVEHVHFSLPDWAKESNATLEHITFWGEEAPAEERSYWISLVAEGGTKKISQSIEVPIEAPPRQETIFEYIPFMFQLFFVGIAMACYMAYALGQFCLHHLKE